MFDRPYVPRIPENVAFKWSANVLDEGFVPFPKRLLRCLGKCFAGDTAIDELRVVLAIVDYRRPRLPHPPSLEFLAFTADMEPQHFWTVLEGLKQKSLLNFEGTQAHLDVDLSPLLKKIEAFTIDHPAGGTQSPFEEF